MVLHDWLISLNKMFSRSINVAAYIGTSFLFIAKRISCYQLIDIWVVSVLAIMSNAAMNIHI